MPTSDLYMRYLGVLGILSEASVYVPEEIRESIEQSFEDACKHHSLRWKRILNRIEIEPKPERYFLIISNYINYPMGCCSTCGIEGVHDEEPDAKFYEITKEELEKFGEEKYPKDKDWLAESKFYDEIV